MLHWISLSLSHTHRHTETETETETHKSHRERNVKAIYRMLAVLSGCVCSSISFSSVWSGSVLEIEGEFKAWWLFQTFLSSLHVWMPSSSLPSQDCSWYNTLLFTFYLGFLFWLIWVLGRCKFLILIDYMLIRGKLSNTLIMNLCFWFDVVADLVN